MLIRCRGLVLNAGCRSFFPFAESQLLQDNRLNVRERGVQLKDVNRSDGRPGVSGPFVGRVADVGNRKSGTSHMPTRWLASCCPLGR